MNAARPRTVRIVEFDDCGEARTCALLGAERPVERQRVDDAVAGEGIDHQPLLVGGDDLLLVGFQIENALVELNDRLHKGPAPVKPRLAYHQHRLATLNNAHRLAELQNDRPMRLIDDKRREENRPGANGGYDQ